MEETLRTEEWNTNSTLNAGRIFAFRPLVRALKGRSTCRSPLVGLLFVCVACAQPNITGPVTPPTALAFGGLYLSPSQISSVLLPQYFAMGDRLSKPGNERITLQGTMTDSSGPSSVQIVLELGGKLNITWTGPTAQKLVFDGKTPPAIGSIPNTNDLLETFVDDLPESLLLVGRGVSPRLLGQKFADGSGGFCDYYDVATYGSARKLSKPFIKRYCFDSKTSLLKSVRYYTNSQLAVTEFGGWAQVNQQAVLGAVTRTVAGSRIFQFQAHGAAVSGSVPDNAFKP